MEPNEHTEPVPALTVDTIPPPIPVNDVRRFKLDRTYREAWSPVIRLFAYFTISLVFSAWLRPFAIPALFVFWILVCSWFAVLIFVRWQLVAKLQVEHVELLLSANAARLNFAGLHATTSSGEILREDVSRIYEVPRAMVVLSEKSARVLSFAVTLADYAIARALFETWAPIEKVSTFKLRQLVNVKKTTMRDLTLDELAAKDQSLRAEIAMLRSIPATRAPHVPPSSISVTIRAFIIWLGLVVVPVMVWYFLRTGSSG